MLNLIDDGLDNILPKKSSPTSKKRVKSNKPSKKSKKTRTLPADPANNGNQSPPPTGISIASFTPITSTDNYPEDEKVIRIPQNHINMMTELEDYDFISRGKKTFRYTKDTFREEVGSDRIIAAAIIFH